MSKLAIALTLALLALTASEARAWTAQQSVTSATNQQQYKRDGTRGAALTLAAQDASTDCTADLTDLDAATDATADLTCHNTGEIVLGLNKQVSVELDFTRSSGTAVVMQCDTSRDGGSTWAPIMTETCEGVKTVRTWTATMSISGRVTHNFEVNAELLRCRVMVTNGASGDTVGFIVYLAR